MSSPLAQQVDPHGLVDQARLQDCYAEPWRFYHGPSHLEALLELFATYHRHLADPLAIWLALWYHDAIYRPERKDNEEASVLLLCQDLAGAGAEESVALAAQVVRATAGHHIPQGLSESQAADCAVFLDMDLSVLGAAPAVYDAYETGVAAEYEPVYGRDAYRAGRRAVLGALLDRPRLYFSPYFTHLERPARNNLWRALDALGC